MDMIYTSLYNTNNTAQARWMGCGDQNYLKKNKK